MTDRYKEALDEWPVSVHPRLGLGPMYDDIGNWYGKHANTIRQALSSMIEGGWKDISTAPRNGTYILLYDGEIHEGAWVAVEYNPYDIRHPQGMPVMGWDYGNAIIDGSNFKPTHWMPLPVIPAAPEGERDE